MPGVAAPVTLGHIEVDALVVNAVKPHADAGRCWVHFGGHVVRVDLPPAEAVDAINTARFDASLEGYDVPDEMEVS